MENTNPQIIVTPEQIEAWKKGHGKVYRYTVDDKTCYLKSVSRELYARAATKVSTSPAKFNEVIIEGVWLGGDEAIKNEDGLFFGLSDFVEQLMNKTKGELGEL